VAAHGLDQPAVDVARLPGFGQRDELSGRYLANVSDQLLLPGARANADIAVLSRY
jgi:hypothetical protein